MKNKIFREIGYWGALGAAALSLINCIVYLIKGIVILNSQHEDNYNLFSYFFERSYDSIILKISLVVFALSLLALMISFFINAKPVLKIIMAIFKIVQAASVALLFVLAIKNQSIVLPAVLVLAGLELGVIVLYFIERDHRRTMLKVILFFIITVLCPIIFVLIALLLIFSLISFIIGLFQEPDHEQKWAIFDINGDLIGWLKREE